jgi:hypothetical protein
MKGGGEKQREEMCDIQATLGGCGEELSSGCDASASCSWFLCIIDRDPPHVLLGLSATLALRRPGSKAGSKVGSPR